ncbi:MAG: hypothetical protein QXH27_05465 [Candidatus Micrarchaeia archaeon]
MQDKILDKIKFLEANIPKAAGEEMERMEGELALFKLIAEKKGRAKPEWVRGLLSGAQKALEILGEG